MAAGVAPVAKLHEDDLVFCIRDIHPRAPSHVMIIPREHIPSAGDLSEDSGPLLGHMFSVANKMAQDLSLEKGYRLTFNVGDEGGQTIFHLHLHLLGGRRLGPEG
jgi:histidine triad (HIT) family protein